MKNDDVKSAQRYLNPWQKILRAVKRGTGLRLSEHEVWQLSIDDAIQEAATQDRAESAPESEAAGNPVVKFPYIYSWGPRGNLPGAMSRKGQRCRIVAPPAGARGGMNSALIEFEDGFRAVISRNALRRHKGAL